MDSKINTLLPMMLMSMGNQKSDRSADIRPVRKYSSRCIKVRQKSGFVEDDIVDCNDWWIGFSRWI